MKTIRIRTNLQIVFAVVFFSAPNLFSQSCAHKFESPYFTLKERIAIVTAQALKQNIRTNIWIAYAVKIKIQPNEIDLKPAIVNKPTLSDIISGNIETEVIHQEKFKKSILKEATRLAFENTCDEIIPPLLESEEYALNEGEYIKKIAIIFDVSLATEKPLILNVYQNSLSSHFEIYDKKIYWLGIVDQKESLNLIVELFQSYNYMKLRRQLLSVAGIHEFSPIIGRLFMDVILNDNSEKLQEDCIFLLGKYSNNFSDNFLFKIYSSLRDKNLRKKIVLALGQSKTKKAFKFLYYANKREHDKSVRKEILFSLSQMQIYNPLSMLEEVVFTDKELDVQQFTVFLISQMVNKKAIFILEKISLNHPANEVRKKALYWLDKVNHQKVQQFISDIYSDSD